MAAAVARPNGFHGLSLKDIDRTMYSISGDLSGAASSERKNVSIVFLLLSFYIQGTYLL